MEEERGIRFFRVLLHDFSSKLSLPYDFIKLINGRRREVATLLSPNGKMWDVDCHKEANREVFFGGTNWKDFIHANNLRDGFFLVFHYKGHMVFSFRAFDLTTKEIAYAPVVKSCTKRKTENIVGDNVEDLDSENIGESIEAATNKKRKGTDKGRCEDPLLIKVQFEVTIELSNLNRRRCCVKIPEEITSSCGLLKHIDEITLEDTTGRKWTATLEHFVRSHAIYISKGWKGFVHANELKVGDKCIFDLSLQPKKAELTMKVQIVNKNAPIVTPVQTPIEVYSSRSTNRNFSSVQVTMKVHNLNRNSMYIPVAFLGHIELGESSQLNLRDSKGQMWPVTIRSSNRHESRKGRECYLSEGWLQFARGNNLGVGDVCTFEMVSRDRGNVVVQVHVAKKRWCVQVHAEC